ncbi:MAG: hypothetical protein WD342_08990 [Verrucomicrobiales bacterium]
MKAQLSSKVDGFREVVDATHGDPDLSALMLIRTRRVKKLRRKEVEKLTRGRR